MTRTEICVLSQAHAVALSAMAASETRRVPMAAALALQDMAAARMPEFAAPCARFVASLRLSHGRFPPVYEAGRALRAAVCAAMAFVPCDAKRVDIHG